MLLGYNTNGLAHHDLQQAINLLAEIGYQSVAITIDHQALSPQSDWRAQAMQVKAALDGNGMRSVIETGARFLLDQWTKHEPTLVSADPLGRARRIDFYRHAIDVARFLQSDCVSIWSGAVRNPVAPLSPHNSTSAPLSPQGRGAGGEGHNEPDDAIWTRLVSGLTQVCEYAAERGMEIGFEPEPGMFIDTMPRFEQLLDRVDSPCLKLTLDVGHLHCQGEVPIADQIRHWAPQLANIHIEDMRAGVHEHRMFGEGEMNFPPIVAALRQIDYRGGIHVELSRHSHDGPNAARKAFEFLRTSGFPA